MSLSNLKVIRGPYLECWIIRPKKATPEVIIPYGYRRSDLFENFDQAEQFAKRVLKLDAAENALKAVNDLFDGIRDDVDQVVTLIQNAVSDENENT